MQLITVLALASTLSTLITVQCSQSNQYGMLKTKVAAFAGKRTVANGVSPKSPLLEIVLRILDTIQIVPKKRSRRHATSLTHPSPLFGRPLFRARAEQPLMALSLESSETDPKVVGNGQSNEEEEDSIEEDTSLEHYEQLDLHRNNDQLLRYMHASTSERFYDLVLDVLQVLESQARQEVHRARLQLEAEQLSHGKGSSQSSQTNGTN